MTIIILDYNCLLYFIRSDVKSSPSQIRTPEKCEAGSTEISGEMTSSVKLTENKENRWSKDSLEHNQLLKDGVHSRSNSQDSGDRSLSGKHRKLSYSSNLVSPLITLIVLISTPFEASFLDTLSVTILDLFSSKVRFPQRWTCFHGRLLIKNTACVAEILATVTLLQQGENAYICMHKQFLWFPSQDFLYTMSSCICLFD